MLSGIDAPQTYLACGATDLRRSIDGLAAIVSQVFALDPFAPALFVFCNRKRDKLKILHWDHNGFWLHYRRLERGRFQWPESAEPHAVRISRRQLQWLLDGLALEQPKAHAPVRAQTAI